MYHIGVGALRKTALFLGVWLIEKHCKAFWGLVKGLAVQKKRVDRS